MKKLTKMLTITGGICAGLGLIFLIVGLVLGGNSVDFMDAMSVQGKDFSGWIQKMKPTVGEYRDDDIENLNLNRWKCISGLQRSGKSPEICLYQCRFWNRQ